MSDPAVVDPKAATPPPATPPEGEPPKDSADAIREKFTKQGGFWNAYIPERPKPAPEDKAPEAPPEPKPEPTPEDAHPAGDEPKPDAKAKPKRSKKPEVDPIKIAEAAGREIASGLAKEFQQPAQSPKTPAPEPTPELPEEFQADAEVFTEMVSLFGDKYKELPKQLGDYAKKESAYIDRWERENPGQTFNGEDQEHNQFYQSIQPKYQEKDFKRAQESLIERRVEERVAARMAPKFERYEAERQAKDLEPILSDAMLGLANGIVEEIDPANKDLGKDWNSLKSLEEKNPMAADVLVHVAQVLKPLLESNYRIYRNIERYNQSNPAHQELSRILGAAEDKVLALAREDRVDEEGRMFATAGDYAKMPPAQQARHWFINETHMAEILTGRARAMAKTLHERELARYQAWSKQNGHAPNSAPPEKPPTPEPPKDTKSPSMTGRATLPSDRAAAPAAGTDGKSLFWKSYFGR